MWTHIDTLKVLKSTLTVLIWVWFYCEEANDAFYEQLQAELEGSPRLKIVMGDLSQSWEPKHQLRKSNGEWRMWNHERQWKKAATVELCTTYNLIIGGTLFPYHDIHKLTWCSPNGRDKNQIDHLMVNGTWRRSLLDVRVRRGADVNSDHHLVTAVLNLKLRRTERRVLGRQLFRFGEIAQPQS